MPTEAELVTPERVLFSGEAAYVVLRTDGGEIMFLPEHAPYIAAVDISLLRIAPPGAVSGGTGPAGGSGGSGGSGGPGGPGGEAEGAGVVANSAGEFRAAVHGGFVHVAGNKVTVLASVAERAEEIDVDRARRAAEAARAAGAGEQLEREREEAATALPGTDQEGGAGAAEESPTLRALWYPDAPDVALRRAEVRLEAAGAETPGAVPGSGGATTGAGSR